MCDGWVDIPQQILEEFEARSEAALKVFVDGDRYLAEYMLAQNLGIVRVWIDATERMN